MTLKGEARTRYMRGYMRRKRAAQRAKAPGLTRRVKPAQAAPDTTKDLEIAELKARVAELEHERTRRREAAPLAGDEVADPQAENVALRDEVIELKTVLGAWRNVVQSRESGIMRLAAFKLIRSCLHPDSRNSASDEKLAKAFRIFNRLEYVLCDEAELPTKEYAHTAKEWAWIRGRKERQKLAAKNAKHRARSGSSSRPAKPLPDRP